MNRFTTLARRLTLTLTALTLSLGLASISHAQAPATTSETPAPTGRTLSFLKPELDVVVNGRKGVRFFAKVEVKNAKGEQVSGRIYVLGKEGKPIDAIDLDYSDVEGRLCTKSDLVLSYDPAHVTFRLFLPYEAITTDPGNYTIKFCLNVLHEKSGKFILDRPHFGDFPLDIVEKTTGR